MLSRLFTTTQDSDDVRVAGSPPATPTQPAGDPEQTDVEQRIARRSIASEVWSMGRRFQGAAFSRFFGTPTAPPAVEAQPAPEPVRRGLPTIEQATERAKEKWDHLCLWMREARDSLMRKVVFNPLVFIGDFMNILASIVTFPFILCFLYLSMMVSNYAEKHSFRFGQANQSSSLINLANPTLLPSEEARKTVESARATLSGLSTTFPDAPPLADPGADEGDLKTTRIFDLDVAKTLLLMSTLVYEVRDADVEAARSARRIEDVERLLSRSEKFIKNQASNWGLRYLSMSGFKPNSNLGSKAGPFASAFYTPPGSKEPFIVLCFKGTTPNNFAEFLVDASISRISCASFFGDGTAHRGFLSELFPVGRNSSDDYGQITRALRHLAADLASLANTEDPKPIPLWITGHSLGAALASLIYARYLRYPRDLGDGIVLRDGYTFGCPRVGDGTFASRFEASASNPIERPNILWRVRNDSDIISRIPLGLADDELNRPCISALSMLNYGHIGIEVKLRPDQEPFYIVDTTSLHSATRVLVVKEHEQEATRGSRWFPDFREWWSDWWNVGKWASWIFVRAVEQATPIWNHFPASYYAHLSHIKVDGKGGAARSSATRAGANRR